MSVSLSRWSAIVWACVIVCIAAADFAPSTSAQDNPGQKGAKQAGGKAELDLAEVIKRANRLGELLKKNGALSHPGAKESKPEQPRRRDPLPVRFAGDVPEVGPAGEVATQHAPSPPPPDSPLAIRSEVIRRIVEGDMDTVEHVQARIAQAVVKRTMEEEVGRELFEAVQQLADQGPQIRKARQRRIGVSIGANLEQLFYASGTSQSAVGGPAPEIASSLAEEALAFQRYQEPSGPVRDELPKARFFDVKSQLMGDVGSQSMDYPSPLPRKYREPHHIRVPSPIIDNKQGMLVPKGVKIQIDDAMLAEVLAGQGTADDALAEIEGLEDALLGARDEEEALRILQEYTEAKKTAFLESGRKFRRLGNVRLVSLKQLMSKLAPYRSRWSERPADLRTVGGLTRIHGFFRDDVQQDLLLVGRAVPGDPPILIDNLIVGLRSVWLRELTPGCSLDPDPFDPYGPQQSSIIDVPEDSSFALIMLKADYAMKLIMFGIKGEELDIPGYRTSVDCAFARPSPGERVASRFWLFPAHANLREIQLGLGGTSAVFEARVKVLTEKMAISERGMQEGTTRTVHPADQEAAQSFTDYYDQIAEKRPIFKQLQGLFDIVLLAKILQFVAPAPGHPVLSNVTRLPYEPVSVPKTYQRVAVVHRRVARRIQFSGGCDIRNRLGMRNMIEARSRSLDSLTEAAAGVTRQGKVFQDVSGKALALPEMPVASSEREERPFSLGGQLLGMGKLAEARDQFSAAIAADDTFARAYAARAVARLYLGEHLEALSDAALAVALDRQDVSVRANWYFLLEELGVPHPFSGIDPAARRELAFMYFFRGSRKSLRGDFKGGVEDLTRTLQLEPKNMFAYTNRAAAKVRLGDLKGGLEDCGNAKANDPENRNVFVHVIRGVANINARQYREAESDFTAALKIDPNYAPAYSNRGVARFELNNRKGAFEDFAEALKIDPQLAAAYYNRGIFKGRIGDRQGAHADLTAALERARYHVPAYNVRGHLRIALGDLDGAKKDFEEALALDPNSVQAFVGLGGLEFGANRFKEAIKYYSAAIRIDRECTAAFYGRGLVKAVMRDSEGAIEDFSATLEIEPNHVFALFERGLERYSLAQKRRSARPALLRMAEQDVQKAIDLGGRNWPDRELAEDTLRQIRALRRSLSQ